MHFRARAYDPRLGRFIQTDPIFGNRPLEHYIYAGNNPINMLDPMGLQVGPLDPGYGQPLRGGWGAKAADDPVLVGTTASAGALKALFVGTLEFSYYGTGNIIYQITGWKSYKEHHTKAAQLGDAIVSFVSHPHDTTYNLIMRSSEKLSRGDMGGAAEFGEGAMGSYMLVRGGTELAKHTVKAAVRVTSRTRATAARTNVQWESISESKPHNVQWRSIVEPQPRVTWEGVFELKPKNARWGSIVEQQPRVTAKQMPTLRPVRSLSARIKDFRSNPANWERVYVDAAKASAKQARGGVSIESIYRHKTTGETLHAHDVFDAAGKQIRRHPTYRDYGKGE